MSELTLSAMEQLLDTKLDEKLDDKLQPVKDVIATLATSEELAGVTARLTAIEQTLTQHTSALDGLVKDVKTLVDEKTIAAARLDRL
jgi:ABC-type transporter Mla subunit MlaD